MIFEAEGDLPAEHTRMYEKIIHVRLREWDLERNVNRKGRYRRFGPDEKHKFLSTIAFEIAKRGQAITFADQTFRSVFEGIADRFGLPSGDHKHVLNELEAHTGLVIASGLGQYEFYHKTIQEYLCGEYLSRLPMLASQDQFLVNMPDACAIATVLSSQPDAFVYGLWGNVFAKRPGIPTGGDVSAGREFWTRYASRLAEERGRFQGDVVLSVGLFSFLSACVSTKIRDEDPEAVRKALEEAASRLEDLPGVSASIAALMVELRPAKGPVTCPDPAGWIYLQRRTRWVQSSAIGTFELPTGFWIPSAMGWQG